MRIYSIESWIGVVLIMIPIIGIVGLTTANGFDDDPAIVTGEIALFIGCLVGGIYFIKKHPEDFR